MKKISRPILVLILAFAIVISPVQAPLIHNSITVQAAVLKLSTSKATLYTGNTLVLKLIGAADNISWASSDKTVARISSAGKVTAIKKGKAIITAIYGDEAFTCVITVKNPGISNTKLHLSVGDTADLTSKGTTAVSFKSSKKSVATVSSLGKIKAKKAGTAKISVKCENGKTYTCTVTVSSELEPQDIYAKCCDSVVEINAGASLGSGFFIEKNTVVTNYHVIKDASKLTATFRDGTECVFTKILGYSEKYDIALLETETTGIPIEINTHGVKTGEKAYAIGSSLGLSDTFSDGMITNGSRTIEDVNYIQTNAAISPGNSGGPLLNIFGEVIGITTATYVNGQNLNLALEISQISKVDVNSPKTVQEYIGSKSGVETLADFIIKNGNINFFTYSASISEEQNTNGDYFGYLIKTSLADSRTLCLYCEDHNTSVSLDYQDDGNYLLQAVSYTNGVLSGIFRYKLDPDSFSKGIDTTNIYDYDAYSYVDKSVFVNNTEIVLGKLMTWLDGFLKTYKVGISLKDLGFTAWK